MLEFPLTKEDKASIESFAKHIITDNGNYSFSIEEQKKYADVIDTMETYGFLKTIGYFNNKYHVYNIDLDSFIEWTNKEDKKARKIPAIEIKRKALDIITNFLTSAITAVITAIITVKLSRGI